MSKVRYTEITETEQERESRNLKHINIELLNKDLIKIAVIICATAALITLIICAYMAGLIAGVLALAGIAMFLWFMCE